MRIYNTNTNLNMNLSGRYGASIGRSLGCSELHRCEQPFRARPADVIIIERQQRQANWHEARNVCSSRTNGCYCKSPVIKAKEIQIAAVVSGAISANSALRMIRLAEFRYTHRSLASPFSRKAFNELYSWYYRLITIYPPVIGGVQCAHYR